MCILGAWHVARCRSTLNLTASPPLIEQDRARRARESIGPPLPNQAFLYRHRPDAIHRKAGIVLLHSFEHGGRHIHDHRRHFRVLRARAIGVAPLAWSLAARAAAVAAAAVLPESNEETRGNTNDGKGEKPIQRLQQQEKDIKDELQSSSSADATILLPNHWSDNILLEPTKRLQEEYMLLRAEIPPDEDCVIGATPAAAADATTSSNRMSGQGDKDTFSIEKKGENRIISSPSSRASEKLLSDIDKDLENLRALHSGSISPAKDGIDTSQTLDSSLDSEFLAGIRKGADPKDIFLEDDMDDDELLKQLQAELEDSSM
mmetsp:Transcript_32907/g.45929  ORF Transcript_32907/g.45929 Transcript_32907/m.45929 type:complete len:318 (+) Transcript_32907:221-1174(+)